MDKKTFIKKLKEETKYADDKDRLVPLKKAINLSKRGFNVGHKQALREVNGE